MQVLSHNVHQARALKALVAVRVAKKAGVSVTIAARPQAVVTLVVSRALTRLVVTNLLPTVASARLPHVVTSPSHRAVTSLLLHVAISRLQIVAKNLSPLVAIGPLPHAVINLMQHAAKILTRMRALSHVRLNPVLTVVLQIARPMQVSPLAQHVTLRLVLQHQVVKPLHHAVMAQHAPALLAQVRHALQRVHVVVLPLTAVAVKL